MLHPWAWFSLLLAFSACVYLLLLLVSAQHKVTVRDAQPAASRQTAASDNGACFAKYGSRAYSPTPLQPVVLYSFPGSGNTWTRLLLEYATGIYTGSIYDDSSLLGMLPGEYTCNTSQLAIKAHPSIHRLGLLTGRHIEGNMRNKCDLGNITHFDRAILIYRNPYHAIWSDFQRAVTNSHVGGIPRDKFNLKAWEHTAMYMAGAYKTMWEKDYSTIQRTFQPSDRLFVQYEQLRAPASRLGNLKNMVEFLHFPTTESRLNCSFLLAESKDIHRRPLAQQQVMSIDDAYSAAASANLTCRMWSVFGDYVSQLGYKPFGKIKCSSSHHLLVQGNGSALKRNLR